MTTLEYATPPEVTPADRPSRAAVVTGWALGILPAALFIFSASMKLMRPPGLEKGFEQQGIPYQYALGLGILELACTVVYLVPRTAVLNCSARGAGRVLIVSSRRAGWRVRTTAKYCDLARFAAAPSITCHAQSG